MNIPAPNYQSLGYDKIFVAVDGTPQQELVIQRAIIIAANNNAELYIGHVVDSTSLETAGSYPLELLDTLEKSFREGIAPQIAECEQEPQIRKVELIVKIGRVRETLRNEMIDVIKPDLVICGALGLSNFRYALMGSTSTFLSRLPNCDTLVVK
ncbi:MAG: universal stress protein [Coriobacteriales bacterium]|nr:universal stress protein [Coriobacteriales bacterium]